MTILAYFDSDFYLIRLKNIQPVSFMCDDDFYLPHSSVSQIIFFSMQFQPVTMEVCRIMITELFTFHLKCYAAFRVYDACL